MERPAGALLALSLLAAAAALPIASAIRDSMIADAAAANALILSQNRDGADGTASTATTTAAATALPSICCCRGPHASQQCWLLTGAHREWARSAGLANAKDWRRCPDKLGYRDPSYWKIENPSNCEPGGNVVVPDEDGVPVRIQVLFHRHGWSCANANQDQSRVLTKIPSWFAKLYLLARYPFYSDPPLTDAAIARAKLFGPQIRKKILQLTDGQEPTMFSSVMVRAQETALNNYPDWTLHPIPYIAEEGRNSHNVPEDFEDQKDKLQRPPNLPILVQVAGDASSDTLIDGEWEVVQRPEGPPEGEEYSPRSEGGRASEARNLLTARLNGGNHSIMKFLRVAPQNHPDARDKKLKDDYDQFRNFFPGVFEELGLVPPPGAGPPPVISAVVFSHAKFMKHNLECKDDRYVEERGQKYRKPKNNEVWKQTYTVNLGAWNARLEPTGCERLFDPDAFPDHPSTLCKWDVARCWDEENKYKPELWLWKDQGTCDGYEQADVATRDKRDGEVYTKDEGLETFTAEREEGRIAARARQREHEVQVGADASSDTLTSWEVVTAPDQPVENGEDTQHSE